jgi:ATP-dependent Clp protease ATP-binding subunit ClpA
VSEGYTEEARRVLECAVAEARRLQHERVGTEHLLLGLLDGADGVAGTVLHDAGATLAAARHKVAEAVPAGPPRSGELARSARAERALERAGRFARQERQATVAPEHVLLGVLDVEGLGCQVLRGLGVDVAHLADELVAARAPAPSAPPDDAVAPEGPPLCCPSCGAALAEPLPGRVVLVRPAAAGDDRRVLVPYCGACGAALGAVPT